MPARLVPKEPSMANIERAGSFVKPYRIEGGKHFRLKDHDPADTHGIKSKQGATQALREGVVHLAKLQDRLYADDKWALLLIFQAMDAAGKDGAIKHVMSGVNPQGCQVYSFKSPSPEELDHDFLWRTTKCMPERGRIGIFNRSYYEEVLVVRVHPEFLKAQHLPQKLITKKIWDERYEDIRNFEHYMTRQGVIIRKFFLNVSKKEQKRRFMARLDRPQKNWKFSSADIRERGFWDEYMEAYETMICETSSAEAPWYVIPADNKWFTRVAVAAAIIDTLESLKLAYPDVSSDKLKELAAARKELENQ
jgi:PPK2 family polyphosphate:nucleotide phosphotransferase